MSDEKQIFTLQQVTRSIQKVIEDRYSRLYWVQAEMHKLNFTNKGHCYPELVQKEDGKIVAEMRGTIWKTQFDKISRRFQETVKEPLRDGLSLLFQVKITFHPLYGMGLEIVDIDPTFALGELQKEREATLKRLTKEGILNANQRLHFPLLPQRIAIISVDSSKGLSDFYSVVQNNPWNYSFFFMLFTAQLNGDLAIESIQKQLKRIEKVKSHFDAVAIIRGGGGEIGLSCYNNYELSKSIATFPLPVLTGIGHSTNITVSEMVSFRHSITPTELGEFLIQCFHNFSVPVQEARKTIKTNVTQFIQTQKAELSNEMRIFKNVSSQHVFKSKERLNGYSKSIGTQVKFKFNRHYTELDQVSTQLRRGVKTIKNAENQQLILYKSALGKLIAQKIWQQHATVDDVQVYIQQQMPKYFQRNLQELNVLEKQIQLMDPDRLLKRGYSLSLFNGKAISETNPVTAGDKIETRTFDLQIVSEVIEIKKNNHE